MKFEKVTLGQFEKDLNDCFDKYPKLIDFFNKEGEYIDLEDYYTSLVPPQRATEDSAGYDLFSPISFELDPGEEILIPLGFKIQLDPQVFLDVRPRSGLGSKFYLRLANTIGVIDRGHYNNPENEGNIFVKIRHEGWALDGTWKTLEVAQGQAFAQGILLPHYLTEDDNPREKTRLGGGFGSTDRSETNFFF